MTLQTLLLCFCPPCFAINISPGPNNLLAMSNATRFGFVAAVAGGFGRLLAFAIMITLASLGLAVILQASAWLFFVIKLFGGLYLLWLAWRLWHAPIDEPGVDVGQSTPLDCTGPSGVARGGRQSQGHPVLHGVSTAVRRPEPNRCGTAIRGRLLPC